MPPLRAAQQRDGALAAALAGPAAAPRATPRTGDPFVAAHASPPSPPTRVRYRHTVAGSSPPAEVDEARLQPGRGDAPYGGAQRAASRRKQLAAHRSATLGVDRLYHHGKPEFVALARARPRT